MPQEKSPEALDTVLVEAKKRLEQAIKEDDTLKAIHGVQIPPQLAQFTKGHVLHRDHTCNNMLWAKPLECWLAAYRSVFQLSCENWPEEKKLNAIVFEERINRLVRHCLDCSLIGKKLSLWALARQIYHESDGEFAKFCPKIRNRVLLPMDEVGLWHVLVTTMKERSNAVRIRTSPHAILETGVRYDIQAGEVLWGFFEYLLVPLRDKQVKVLRNLLDKFD